MVGVCCVLSSSSCPVPVDAQSARAISSECGMQDRMDRLMHELCVGFRNISCFSSNFSIFGG